MDGFTSTHKPMFKREGEEINGWIHKYSDSQALTNPCSGKKDRR
jgi:hypothetical protein